MPSTSHSPEPSDRSQIHPAIHLRHSAFLPAAPALQPTEPTAEHL